MKPEEVERDLKTLGGNNLFEGAKARLIKHSFDKLIETLDRHAESNDRLGRKVLGLNIILTLATVVIAAIAFSEFFYKVFNGSG